MELPRTLNPNNKVISLFSSRQHRAASSQAGKLNHSQVITVVGSGEPRRQTAAKTTQGVCFSAGATIFVILFGLYMWWIVFNELRALLIGQQRHRSCPLLLNWVLSTLSVMLLVKIQHKWHIHHGWPFIHAFLRRSCTITPISTHFKLLQRLNTPAVAPPGPSVPAANRSRYRRDIFLVSSTSCLPRSCRACLLPQG